MLYIFTPTYNRKQMLGQLYQSLCKQSNPNFIWLIVDDGSLDGTKDLVEQFLAEEKLNIQYQWKENGGKHSAYNLALDWMPEDGVHVCVDSDDYLGENAIRYFYEDLKNFKNQKDFVGIVYPRTMRDSKGERIQTHFFPREVRKVNIPDILYKWNQNFETCILICNRYLKDFRFPLLSEEKFLSEFVLYAHLADYGMFFVKYRETVYYSGYLEGGLTNSLFIHWKRNVQSTLYDFQKRYEYVSQKLGGRQRFQGLVRIKLNMQALQLSVFPLRQVVREERAPWHLLLPFSVIFQKIRFQDRTRM